MIYDIKLHVDHNLKVESAHSYQEKKKCQYGHNGILGVMVFFLILHTLKFLYNEHIHMLHREYFS